MTGTAKFIRSYTSYTGADQRVYKLDPTLYGNEYVVVSAIDLRAPYPGMPAAETLIFPSDGEDVADFGDIAGLPAEKNHEKALREAGYEIQGDQQ